jgi:hypothetical protein
VIVAGPVFVVLVIPSVPPDQPLIWVFSVVPVPPDGFTVKVKPESENNVVGVETVTAPDVTVTATMADWPPSVAVTVAVPTATAVMVPEETVATAEALVFQVESVRVFVLLSE